MAEYIEREAFRREIDEHRPGRSYEDAWALTILDFIPAADVRPVVLCKDCKWYQINELKKDGTEDRRYRPSVCVLTLQRRGPSQFCSDGVRTNDA